MSPVPASPTGPRRDRHIERKEAIRPFEFWGCHDIRESLGVRADTERELAECLRTVGPDSIFHHSVRSLMRHRVGALAYTDDFARWAAREAGDPELAERIALFSPFDFPTLEDFRAHLVATVEDHIESSTPTRMTARSPFRFLRGHLVALPLEVRADDLASFRAGLVTVDDSSIYFHTVEAPGARHARRSDFAEWVEQELGSPELAERLAAVDPFVAGLTRARGLLVAALDEVAAAA